MGPVRRRWIPGLTDSDATLEVGDGVILYPYCQVLGVNKRLGAGSQVGTLQILTEDLPPNAVYTRGVTKLAA
jgi:serine acetyltransferase